MQTSDSGFDICCSSVVNIPAIDTLPDYDRKSPIIQLDHVPEIDTLPDYMCTQSTMEFDALYEILSWMPAKSAIKYSSSLCKSLHNIHSESDFVKKQCLHSNGHDTAFILQPKYESYPCIAEFLNLPWKQLTSGIPCKSLDFLFRCGRIGSSSNGLLLLFRKNGVNFLDARCNDVEFWVCNPATGASAPLPTPVGFEFVIKDGALGFSSLIECYPGNKTDSFPNDYTIALLVEKEPEVNYETHFWAKSKRQLLIYSNGEWEEDLCDVTINGRELRYDMPVAFFSESTKGLIVHYLCDRGYSEPYIVAYDLQKKKLSREIKLPEGAWDKDCDGQGSVDRLWMFKWNEKKSICLVRWFLGEFKVWVLDECDSCNPSELWRRVMKKTEEEMGFGIQEEDTVESFAFARGIGLVIATKARVYVYVMEGENRGRLEVVGEHQFDYSAGIRLMSYGNTLRPVCV